MIDVGAYEFSLMQDGAIDLYRGRSEQGASVLLATPRVDDTSPDAIARLENAYSIRAMLDPRWASQPLALTHLGGRCALAMKDPGGETWPHLTRGPLDVARFLRVAVSLAAACRQLHEAGLIHRDLKPANVLVDESTGGVWLTGFGFTCVHDRSLESAPEIEEFVGTLAYMAPEQTGRMNRSVDFRSDLYSVGITFYETLTGSLPFAPEDPVALLHAHLARQPIAPHLKTARVPEIISLIVMKLLCKNMDERYQSAAGLEVDLRTCLSVWESSGRINPFSLGSRDPSLGSWYPRKMYGRSRELESLIGFIAAGLDSGRSKAIVISGYSGVGKTTLVEQVLSRPELHRGLFATAKCDASKREVPYGALVNVFQGLVRTVLGSDEAVLNQWRSKLSAALGDQASLILELIPELASITGPGPALLDASPQDAQSRFQAVFRRFVSAFCSEDRPLALFLDDLQWLDAASHSLLSHVLLHEETKHLTIILTYRDNEVESDHPLQLALDVIRSSNVLLREIALKPLSPYDIKQLLADLLQDGLERVEPLAELVSWKTQGNPFFALQFLSELREEGMLRFDPLASGWSWDLPGIRSRHQSDDIVDLMIGKLNRLPVDLKESLKQLACLGSAANVNSLCAVRGESPEQLRTAFQQLQFMGLVSRDDNGYAFSHDRIYEAAYRFTPDDDRAATHLRIAHALICSRRDAKLDDLAFEITGQLNRGAAAIDMPQDKDWAVAFNLSSARRAKAATAYASALTYLAAGEAQLGELRDEKYRRLTFDLDLCRAECEFLTGQTDLARDRLGDLQERAATLADELAVARLRIALHVTLGQANLAVEAGLDFLRQLSQTWSSQPTDDEVNHAHDHFRQQLLNTPLDRILSLPMMGDPECRAAMEVLADLMPPSEFTDPNLLDLVILRMASLSLEYGNCDASCYGYAALHLVLGPRFGDDELGYEFARVGCELVERADLSAFKARVHLCFGGLVIPWSRGLASGQAFVRRAFDEANSRGDLTFASYSNTMLITLLLGSGARLDAIEEEAKRGTSYAQRAGFGLVVDCLSAQMTLTRPLRGFVQQIVAVDGTLESRESFEQRLNDPRLTIAACWYWIKRAQLCFLMNEPDAADEAITKASQSIWSTGRHFERAEYHFYGALIGAACCTPLEPQLRSRHWQSLLAHGAKIEAWAKHCPANFADRAVLIQAEMARLQGRDLEAQRLYEDAIRLAHAHGFVHNEAIANELAFRFYSGRGFETIALAYLGDARRAYSRWGADGKVTQLECAHPNLERIQQRGGGWDLPQRLELATVVKVSQAVSSEINLNRLIETLMIIALQHAGAERGLLIRPGNSRLTLEAEASITEDAVNVVSRDSQITAADLPLSILQFVARTREPVLLDDAADSNPFSEDQYLRKNRCRSILCLPLLKQGQLIGVLYLENNRSGQVFTAARVGVLNLLASQAAISLEIARVYSALERENRERSKAEEALRASEASLALGQQISHTCNWRWAVRTGAAEVSAEWYRIYGLDPPVGGLSFDTFILQVHSEDRAMVTSALAQAAQDRTKFNMEFRIVLPNGSIKHLQSRGHPSLSGTGDLEFVGTDMEITDLREAEEKLRLAQADLARGLRLRAMGELAGSILHEINQPLAAVVTNAEAGLRWLNRETPNIAEAISAVAGVAREGRRASDVVAGLKSLARNAGAELAEVDLHAAIREVLALVRGEFERAGVSLQLDLDAGSARVWSDRVQVQQVLINLIRNGIEAMDGISERTKILRLYSMTDERSLLVAVEDNGIGLDISTAERIFEPLFTTKPDGMGMGLAICRSIIAAHRGRLWVSPRAPHGTTVTFTLPLVSRLG